ncbi:MAG: hypothetical protein KDF60_17355 [Calditrichaeota bacterium]|nr:hypothetical protein [Calditrichota bacterium]
MRKEKTVYKVIRLLLTILFFSSLFHIHSFHANAGYVVSEYSYSTHQENHGSTSPSSAHECYACIVLSAFELIKVNTSVNKVSDNQSLAKDRDYKNPQNNFLFSSAILRAPPQA